jgi:flavin-binding protein dodecin
LILVHLQGPRKAKFDTQLFYVYAEQVKPGREEIATASKTVHGTQSAWVKEQQLVVESGKVTLYRVDWNVTFVLDRQRGQGEFRALRGEEGVFYEAVEVVLIGSLSLR